MKNKQNQYPVILRVNVTSRLFEYTIYVENKHLTNADLIASRNPDGWSMTRSVTFPRSYNVTEQERREFVAKAREVWERAKADPGAFFVGAWWR